MEKKVVEKNRNTSWAFNHVTKYQIMFNQILKGSFFLK